MSTSTQLAMTWRNVEDAWCEALFASGLQPSDAPTAEMVAAAINLTLQQLGVRGCVGRMAQEFGDHPDAAARRMRWMHGLTEDSWLTGHTGPRITLVSRKLRPQSGIADPEHVAGDAVAMLAEQVRDDVCDLVGSARHVDLERHRVDGNVALVQLQRERSGQHVCDGLGGRIETVGPP